MSINLLLLLLPLLLLAGGLGAVDERIVGAIHYDAAHKRRAVGGLPVAPVGRRVEAAVDSCCRRRGYPHDAAHQRASDDCEQRSLRSGGALGLEVNVGDQRA